MHERKARMTELADAFLVLPRLRHSRRADGGNYMGAARIAQQALHSDQYRGYWNGLLAFLDSAVDAGFSRGDRQLLLVASSAADAVRMAAGQ